MPYLSAGARLALQTPMKSGTGHRLHAHVADLLVCAAGVRDRALAPLLEWAAAVVPTDLHAATPIFLLGTAGLRKLDSEPRQRLLAEAQSVLAASSFRYAVET